jgi:hypothetical protein
VVYKLLWHLLKSHRYQMEHWTQASLISMVFDRGEAASFSSFDLLKDHFLAVDHVFRDSVTIDFSWANSILEDTDVGNQVTIRGGSFGISTVMRLLRFLPDKFTDQWLSNLVLLASESLSAVEALSLCPDWQPCLFQFVSELMEKISGLASRTSSTDKRVEEPDQESRVNEKSPDQNQQVGKEKPILSLDVLVRRLDLSLQLYAALLGHRVREGGDKVSGQVDDQLSKQLLRSSTGCLSIP